MRSAVFDLDGTLADTAADLIAAANHCLEPYGTALDAAVDASTAFHGGRAMLRLGLSRLGPVDEMAVDRLYPELLAFYGAHICRHTVLYPGVREALDTLAATGWRLGVCTNKPEGLARTLLGELGLLERFIALIGADTLPVRKPDPAPLLETIARLGGTPARTAMIGDTLTDRATARAAGVPAILVTFGPEGIDVARHSPEALIAGYGELPALLENLIPATRHESA
ncbi:HAD-IA family hydrolase [Paroceanicella profunda]|uniref:Phosphoglycolate phosphatase n=1 Tax=Paroceanicella profunda TaxID=2579971 RepID=A0A5B8FHB2_9RHOB|nr:HAD-IA family hydrolase [Paroceanicella profunda]QDL92231.1 HAD-IA family hydrolase [Paroceanicella profunda]